MAVFGAAAIVGVLIFALMASTSTQTTVGSVVIWGTLDSKVISQVIQDAAGSSDTFSKVTYVQKDPQTYEDDLVRALASGTGPDLIIFDQGMAIKDMSEFSEIPYAEITPTQFQNLFIDAATPLLAHDGVVGLPLLADPMVLYWNKDLLANAGVTQPPTQWSQLFTNTMQSVTQRDDAGNITQSLIDLGGYDNIDHAKDILAMLIMQVGGTIMTMDPTTGTLSATLNRANPGNQNLDIGLPAEVALRFYTEFADPSKNDYTWNGSLPQASQAFAQGTLALYLGLASEEPIIAAANPNLRFGVARVPQSSVGGINIAHIYAIGIARTSKNPAGAKVVAYSLVARSMSDVLAQGYHMTSPRRDSLAAILNPVATTTTSSTAGIDAARTAALGTAAPETTIIAQSASIARSWPDPGSVQTDSIFRDMIEGVTSGALQTTEAVSKANTELLTLINGK